MIAHAVASGDAINTSVWLGEFSHDSAVSFGARPEKEFAGVASLSLLERAVGCFLVIAAGRYLARSCSGEQVSLPGEKCKGL